MGEPSTPIDYVARGFKDLYVTLDGAVAIVTINRPAQCAWVSKLSPFVVDS